MSSRPSSVSSSSNLLTCLASTLHEAAMRLLRENWDWHKPPRSIGVRATDLLPASTPVQCSIFEDSERPGKA